MMMMITRHARSSTAAVLAALSLVGCQQSDQSNAGGTNSGARNAAAPSHATAARGASAANLAPATPQDAKFAAVLTQVVSDDGLVRYRLLAADALHKQLDEAVDAYAKVALPPESESNARLALWCNAYNANAMKMASDESRKDGFKTVHDTAGFFDQHSITVAGEATTLDGLENHMRAMKDPRIHAALVFGAMSCPSLRNEPFTAERLDAQLDEQSRAWLEDLRKNRVTRTTILGSQIFEFKAPDFEADGGAKGFMRKHGHPNGAIRDFMRAVPEVKVTSIPFDWHLNDAGDERIGVINNGAPPASAPADGGTGGVRSEGGA